MTTTTADRRTPLAIKRELMKTTLLIAVAKPLVSDLLDEAKVGSRALLLAVARLIETGERKGNGVLAGLVPPDDAELILDALISISDRMMRDRQTESDNQHVRQVRDKVDIMIRKIEKQGWTVTRGPAGFRVVRVTS